MGSPEKSHIGEPEPAAKEKQARTFGLKAFDTFLYPFLTNFAVFAISVYATYMTSRGHLYKGWLPNKLESRGRALVNWFETRWNMSHGAADMAKMVAFSFIDGSIMAPVIKLFEDRREKIARGIDRFAGTEPDDPSIYAEEPKQSWGSVLGGRLATVSIVVPVAVALQNTPARLLKAPFSKLFPEAVKSGSITFKETVFKLHGKRAEDAFNGSRVVERNGGKFFEKSGEKFVLQDGEKLEKVVEDKNLNQLFFTDPGLKAGKYIEKSPKAVSFFNKFDPPIDIPELGKIGAFEAFYTSVCTFGHYVGSRFLARLGEQRTDKRLEQKATAANSNQLPLAAASTSDSEQRPAHKGTPQPGPKTRVHSTEASTSMLNPEQLSAATSI